MSIKFPDWVIKTKGKQAQASARLRYISVYLCLQVTGKVSYREFHAITGICTHTAIWKYVRDGAFSQSMADKFEAYFGKKVVTAEMLTNPLSIQVK